MIQTAFTAQFGVDLPLMCGGMTGVGRAELVAAVAEAGPSASSPPEQTTSELDPHVPASR